MAPFCGAMYYENDGVWRRINNTEVYYGGRNDAYPVVLAVHERWLKECGIANTPRNAAALAISPQKGRYANGLVRAILFVGIEAPKTLYEIPWQLPPK